MSTRGLRTIGTTADAAKVRAAQTRNNGRYNGNGRHWETPPEVFDPLHAEFSFTLDPCATPATAKCARYFTEADDGLAQDWGRERVFMNPPYGREIYPWTRKARDSAKAGALVVGLLPASTELAWWHEDVVGHVDPHDIRFLRGRVRFLTGGPYRASGFFASVVVIWRPAILSLELAHARLPAPRLPPYDRRERELLRRPLPQDPSRAAADRHGPLARGGQGSDRRGQARARAHA